MCCVGSMGTLSITAHLIYEAVDAVTSLLLHKTVRDGTCLACFTRSAFPIDKIYMIQQKRRTSSRNKLLGRHTAIKFQVGLQCKASCWGGGP